MIKATHYMAPTEARIEIFDDGGKLLATYDGKQDKVIFVPGGEEALVRAMYADHIAPFKK